MLVDSHCHLTDARFEGDRQDVLLRARAAGVGRILVVASHRADALVVARLLGEAGSGSDVPRLWGTAGVHPHEAAGARDDDLTAVRELARTHPRVVAVGETGLDFHYDHSPRDLQEALFRGHMALAEELGLPVVVHSRSADEATARILLEWGPRVRGVLHCFTGGKELLDTALDLGWMVSFTGIITFKKFDAKDLVRAVPSDRLMAETDAPYLAPSPHRGHRNEPAFVGRVVEELAAIREEDPARVMRCTSQNAVRFFNLGP
jgi:TatD DNase family protein